MNTQKLVLPESTRRRLEQFRRRVRVVRIAEGALAGLFGLLLSYLIVFGVDRWIDTPTSVRTTLLIVGSVGLAVIFPIRCHRWLWGTRRMEQVARLLKHSFPALGDQLLGIVELAQSEQPSGGSFRLAQAAIEQVDAVVRERDFSHAVPRPRHRFWATVFAVPAVLTTLALLLVPAAGWNAMTRWLMPWRDVDRYTFAQVDSLPREIVVPHGEEFSVSAKLSSSTKWSPTSASAVFRDQSQVRADRQESGYELILPGQTETGTLHVRVGDLTRDIRVEVANRPELSALTASIELPAYLGYSRPLTIDARGGTLSVLKGSIAALVVQVTRKLRDAAVNNETVPTDGSHIRLAPRTLTSSEILELAWRDELNLTARDTFRLRINATDDSAPSVTLLPDEPLQVVLSTDVITFSIQSRDDYGLRQVGLDWSGLAHPVHNPVPDSGSKLIQMGAPETKAISAKATFCAQTDQVPAQRLEIRAWAEDYFPERERVYSPSLIIHVMTPDQHALWMTEQLRRWASLADDVYEEEIRLHDRNRELRQLDAEQLNAPETRRELEQQATAERANGERLLAVTEHGDELIRQAFRNPEMMVGHLETWAAALRSLRDIGQNRMPSVADLLRQSARASGRNAANPATPRSPAPQAGNNRASTPPGSADSPKSPDAQPPVPALTDTESGFNKTSPQQTPEQQSPGPSSGGKFGLPSTVLQGGPPPKNTDPSTPSEQQLQDAVEEQTDLLADFQRVRDELQKILNDLEDSTFVKRLKAASREQLEVAGDLNRTLFEGFGQSADTVNQQLQEASERIASRESAQGQKVRDIQHDLEAYYDRRPEGKFLRILKEMEEYEVVRKLTELRDHVLENRSGEAIARAEFWSDTLDRWAEELVSASQCGQCKGGRGDSLPPSIVLEVMRILEGEMDLREETRALDRVRPGIDIANYRDKAEEQSSIQRDLATRVENVVIDIETLPSGAQKFAREIRLLSEAHHAMADATMILAAPETGPTAIAAETEAIELLLQSRRANPKAGGGGGGSNPGGGGEGNTDQAAIELYGPGSDPDARIETREVRQATGTSNDQSPAEFRDGIDAFFNALENRKP